jgi:hypothetical protein
MSKKSEFVLFAAVLSLSLGIAMSQASFAADTDMTPEKVIAEHLKSLGGPEVLAGMKSRILNGFSTVQFIQGGHGGYKGEFLMASDDRKLGLVMKYGANEYPQEYFAFDGEKVSVGYIKPGQRSPLADFLFRYNAAMKEGLFGGTLSVAWPLLSIQKAQATMKYREVTVEGKKLHELEYWPKKSMGDLKVKLFFDFEKFHHVRTEYSVRIRNDASALPSVTTSEIPADRAAAVISGSSSQILGRAPNATIMESQADSIYKLVERFDDFQAVAGVTLPFTYNLEYSVEGSGASFIGKWGNRSGGQFTSNAQIGAEFFKAQK